MATATLRAEQLDRARRDFLASGVAPEGCLSPQIRRSWLRCGVSVDTAGAIEPLSRECLSERRDAAEWLLRCARPELDALADHVVGQGCVVILSDASGLILEEIGSPEFLPKARRVALQPGVEWSEQQRGTNAIGTALAERSPVLVLGPEHLLQENGAIGCAAAPILSERGELMGVLDISGDWVHVDAHALGLARLAAAQIEHRSMTRRHQGAQAEALVRFHSRPQLLGSPREGLLSVAGGRVLGLNRIAAKLLGGGWQRWLGAPIEQVFGARWSALRASPGLFGSADGTTWAVAVDRPVRGAGTMAIKSKPTEPLTAIDDGFSEQVEKACRVLDAGLSVLVTGETGAGKEVFARRLHERCTRARGPLVVVNCAALPETLIDAELFGYDEGAYTGARRGGRAGRIREAQGGVLLLDEIGDMPLALQTRLLRVLEERCLRPLGAAADVAVDFALVCASHRDLDAEVRAGRFRQDLLYRIRGFEVRLLPLRDRPDRRGLISRLFRELGALQEGITLSPGALDALDRHAWPGNVRELVAVLRAAVALAERGQAIEAEDLSLRADPAGHDVPRTTLSSAKQELVRQTLADCGGNVAAAARALGIHRSTLYRQLGLDRQAR